THRWPCLLGVVHRMIKLLAALNPESQNGYLLCTACRCRRWLSGWCGYEVCELVKLGDVHCASVDGRVAVVLRCKDGNCQSCVALLSLRLHCQQGRSAFPASLVDA